VWVVLPHLLSGYANQKLSRGCTEKDCERFSRRVHTNHRTPVCPPPNYELLEITKLAQNRLTVSIDVGFLFVIARGALVVAETRAALHVEDVALRCQMGSGSRSCQRPRLPAGPTLSNFLVQSLITDISDTKRRYAGEHCPKQVERSKRERSAFGDSIWVRQMAV
jgi:hypothetical protein